MTIRIGLTGLVLSLTVLTACDPGQPSGTNSFVASGKVSELSAAEYSALTPEDQYRVASKLMGTIFRGIPADEFFDMSALEDPDLVTGGNEIGELVVTRPNFIAETRAALRTDMNLELKLEIDGSIDGLDDEGNPDPDAALYDFRNERPRQIPLARIKEYPISRDLYINWMAYFLTNTIMFSPATEMESAFTIDAQRVFRFLVTRMTNGDSIRSIIRSNLGSLHRWRVSRSPENHALEAFELYLGLFETEEDSYRGGIACKDYYLTDEGRDYLLDVTDFPNYEPQLILDSYYVTSCEDLYDVIAGHPLLIPRVTEVIVNYLMAGRSLDDRIATIASVTSGDPETFEDIFTAILFSREYLLNTERPKSFEENLMPMLDSLKWTIEGGSRFPVNRSIFRYMTEIDGNVLYMPNMSWDSMALKIGRLPDVPLDALSFASYHKGMREGLLMNTNAYSGAGSSLPQAFLYDDDGDVLPMIENMSMRSFIDYLFITTLQRKATDVEYDDLIAIVIAEGYTRVDGDTGIEHIRDFRLDDTTHIVNDYISRLPELYFFKSVASQSGGAS